MSSSILTPYQLDLQSKIKIDKWLDVDSDEVRSMDDNHSLTKLILRRLYEEQPAYLFTDTLGRLWGKGEDSIYYPFHFNYGNKLIGYRLIKKAAN
jgi:hypothetical protein